MIWNVLGVGRGGRIIRKISQEAFPYPVFGRFVYTLSALYRHYS